MLFFLQRYCQKQIGVLSELRILSQQTSKILDRLIVMLQMKCTDSKQILSL